ncbi:MAG: hypothetical protein ACI87O_002941, partial [Planctomycetota bacterium]
TVRQLPNQPTNSAHKNTEPIKKRGQARFPVPALYV